MRLAMAVGNGRRYRISEIVPRQFEQNARQTGFSVAALHEVMIEIIELLPSVSNRLQREVADVVPETMVESVLIAAKGRAEQIEIYLNG